MLPFLGCMILSKPLSLKSRKRLSALTPLFPRAPLSLTALGFSRHHFLSARLSSSSSWIASPTHSPNSYPQRDDSDLCVCSPHSLLSLRPMFPAPRWASWRERPTGTSHSTHQNPSSSFHPNSILHHSGCKPRKQLNFSLQPVPSSIQLHLLIQGFPDQT